MIIRLVDNNLSYRLLLLGHLNLFLVTIFKYSMLAVPHHYVKAGIVTMLYYSNNLVVVVQFIFRWVLVVLDAAY